MGKPCYPDMPHSKGEENVVVKQESKILPIFSQERKRTTYSYRGNCSEEKENKEG